MLLVTGSGSGCHFEFNSIDFPILLVKVHLVFEKWIFIPNWPNFVCICCVLLCNVSLCYFSLCSLSAECFPTMQLQHLQVKLYCHRDNTATKQIHQIASFSLFSSLKNCTNQPSNIHKHFYKLLGLKNGQNLLTFWIFMFRVLSPFSSQLRQKPLARMCLSSNTTFAWKILHSNSQN